MDDYSRVTWLHLMKKCSELFSIFQKFYAEIKNQFDTFVRILRSDNSKEFFSSSFVDFMSQSGIVHQSLCSYTPQQNNITEHKNRHLLEDARMLLIHIRVPKVF